MVFGLRLSRSTRLRPLFSQSWRCARRPAARLYQSQTRGTRSPLAFAFDIDGVLLHGARALPAGRKALQILEGQNPLSRKIPYILMTNGGGTTEEERAAYLTTELGVTITPRNLLQAHTPLRAAAAEHAEEPVLILGGKLDVCRKVAESYGYLHAYLATDYLAADPRLWPFYDLSEAEKAVSKPNPPHPCYIFVFHDPRNWALEIQLVCDLLTDPMERPPRLVFCNPDLLWRSDHPRPRFGQGAFKQALSSVYKAKTGKDLEYVQFGKPTSAQYDFAEALLMEHAGVKAGDTMPKVYMIGDNPASDIAGARAKGWESVLVHTGVYDPSEGPPAHEPTAEAEDVVAAVEWAIERELQGAVSSDRSTWHGRHVALEVLG